MKFNYFLDQLNFTKRSTSSKRNEDDFANKFGADLTHYSGGYPAVLFKVVSTFSTDELKEIAEVQRKIWNDSSITFLYVTSPFEIRVYNCNARPIFFNDPKIKIEDELNKSLIVSCQKDDFAKLT